MTAKLKLSLHAASKIRRNSSGNSRFLPMLPAALERNEADSYFHGCGSTDWIHPSIEVGPLNNSTRRSAILSSLTITRGNLSRPANQVSNSMESADTDATWPRTLSPRAKVKVASWFAWKTGVSAGRVRSSTSFNQKDAGFTWIGEFQITCSLVRASNW